MKKVYGKLHCRSVQLNYSNLQSLQVDLFANIWEREQ